MPMRELILLVQGEIGHRAARRSLEQAGFSVRLLAPAVAIDENLGFRASLILIDATQKDRRGLETCRQIRENVSLSLIPIVVLTGACEQSRERALEFGADDCIAEPFSPRELVARVQSVLRR